jgi:hypothetical protein
MAEKHPLVLIARTGTGSPAVARCPIYVKCSAPPCIFRAIPLDTTSFAVSGAYAADESADSEASVIAITYGYSRDHREDLKQWMLATSHDP